MHIKSWIFVFVILLLATGGFFYFRPYHLSTVLEPVGERESEEDEANSPEFRIDSPDNHRPTHWSYLDDTGTNHRCNQDSVMAVQNETPCAASPLNPDILMVGCNDYRLTDVAAYFCRSTNGGGTWQSALFTYGPTGLCQFAGDPSLAADATGKFYAVYCTYSCTDQQGVHVQTSTDSGSTWAAPVSVGVTNGASYVTHDKPMTACDYSPGSPYLNNNYVVWMNLGDDYSISFSRSTNGGTSYSTPVRISTNGQAWCPAISVGPNGEVYAIWIRATTPAVVELDRSLDGGVTWRSIDIRVAGTNSISQPNPCGSFRIYHSVSVACDITNGPRRGYVYACWDASRGSDGSNVYFSRSTDQGLTWSDTVRVNDDQTTRMQWWSWIAVNPKTGDIGISWMDRRGDPNNCTYAMYGTVSTDGGLTWSQNFRISDQIANPSNADFMGDYTGATFSRMGFASVWTDTRNDNGDIYSAWWNNGDSLRLLTPNGGEMFTSQQPCTVRWQFRYAPDSLYISLNRNYPSGTWESLGSAKSDSGYFVWHVSGQSTTAARLRLSSQTYFAVGDTSDANFSIGLPSPSHLTAYRMGNDIRLRWDGTGASYYHIYSSISPDSPFTSLEGSTSATSFTDTNGVSDPLKFYIVKASTEP